MFSSNFSDLSRCESNYEITRYVAEFWNTISNSIMLILPLYSLYWSYTHISFARNMHKKSDILQYHFTIPKSVILTQLSLITVGIGSWCFHMTLLYSMQLLDELPMIYGSAVQVYANYDLLLANMQFKETLLERKRKKSVLTQVYENRLIVFILLLSYCVLSTVIYIKVWNNPIFHELCYGTLAVTIIIQSFVLIHRLNSDKRVYYTGILFYALAFFFWNVDNNFCKYLSAYREIIEQTLGVSVHTQNFRSVLFNSFAIVLKSISELHALWHILVGYASFMGILFITDLNYRFHLEKINKQETYHEKKPLGLKYSFYYHLTNDLLEKDRPKLV